MKKPELVERRRGGMGGERGGVGSEEKLSDSNFDRNENNMGERFMRGREG